MANVPRKQYSVSDNNSPGVVGQGPFNWPPSVEAPTGDLIAVDDYVYTQVGYGVIVSVLTNDIGVGGDGLMSSFLDYPFLGLYPGRVTPARVAFLGLLDFTQTLSVISATLQDPTDGTVTTNGITVTFIPSNTKFAELAVGESVDISIEYTITDGLNTDSAYVIVRLTRQFDIWIDQDNSPIIDHDNAFIAQYPISSVFVWIDQDGLFLSDQDEALIALEV